MALVSCCPILFASANTCCISVSTAAYFFRPMVKFATMSEIRFYERPDEARAKELHYSKEDIRQLKIANRQAVQDVHIRQLSLVNDGTEDDARVVFQGHNLTGIENLLTPSLVRKSMACKAGYRDAILDEQDRQDASGCYDPIKLACAAEDYSRWATKRSVMIGTMHHMSIRST